jgi:hypothetical protein
VTLSPELTLPRVRALVLKGGAFILGAYGRERLMTLSHCPARVAQGLSTGHAGCDLCGRGDGVDGTELVDRRGVRFPLRRVRTVDACRVRVYNSVPTDVTNRFDALRGLPVGWRVSFVEEPPAERAAVVARIRGLIQGEPHSIEGGYTFGGLFRRESEVQGYG